MAMKVRGGSSRYHLRGKEPDSPHLFDSDSNSESNFDCYSHGCSEDNNRCKDSYSEDGNLCKDDVDHCGLAHKALAKFNVYGKNRHESFHVPSKSYYFVDANGPVSLGYFRNLRILHFNFLAKDKEGHSSADVETQTETFFSEVSVDKHGSVTVDSVYRLGPTHTLPETANIYDCSYCLSLNIHHPLFRLSFRSGRADHLKSVVSKITCLDTDINKCKRKRKLSPEFSDPGVHIYNDTIAGRPDIIAKVALRKFHAQHQGTEGANYEFVKVGYHNTTCNKYGLFMHINFEAKTKDDNHPAQVHTFFC